MVVSHLHDFASISKPLDVLSTKQKHILCSEGSQMAFINKAVTPYNHLEAKMHSLEVKNSGWKNQNQVPTPPLALQGKLDKMPHFSKIHK